MTKFAVLGHTVQTFSQDPPEIAWYEAPLGSVPITAVRTRDGVAIVSRDPVGAIDVHYPLVILPGEGAVCELPIGRGPGEFIAVVNLPHPEKDGTMQAFIFRGSPWPTTALEGARIEGNA